MRINRSQLDKIANIYRSNERKTENLKERGQPAPKKDQVILSKEAQKLQAAAKDDSKRLEKLDKLKTLIEKGQYKVDSKKLAEKMIECALEKERM